jgi:hypothetical protein
VALVVTVIQSEALPEYIRFDRESNLSLGNCELDLLACLAAPHAPNFSVARARRILQQEQIDWQYLFTAMALHGVFPNVGKAFKTKLNDCIAPGQLKKFNQHYARTMRLNMSLIASFAQFQRRLQAEGIRSVTYKGPALAAQVYGDAFLREFSDIDVLVHVDDAARAQNLLLELGYGPGEKFDPPLPASFYQSQNFFSMTNEHTYERQVPRGVIDLHWHVQPLQFLSLPTEYVLKHTQPVSFEGIVCDTISSELAVLVNAAHAGKHQFQRLLWTVDAAELLCAELPVDWDLVVDLAHKTGNILSVAVSLLLAHEVFGAPMPSEISRLVDKRVRKLCHEVIDNIKTLDLSPRGATLYPLGFSLALKDTLRDQATFFVRELFGPSLNDIARLRLSPSLDWMYPPLHPILLLKDGIAAKISRTFQWKSNKPAVKP